MPISTSLWVSTSRHTPAPIHLYPPIIVVGYVLCFIINISRSYDRQYLSEQDVRQGSPLPHSPIIADTHFISQPVSGPHTAFYSAWLAFWGTSIVDLKCSILVFCSTMIWINFFIISNPLLFMGPSVTQPNAHKQDFLTAVPFKCKKSTTFIGVIDLFQIICALCMVQCESRAKSTTSDRIVSNYCARFFFNLWSACCLAESLHLKVVKGVQIVLQGAGSACELQELLSLQSRTGKHSKSRGHNEDVEVACDEEYPDFCTRAIL